MKLRLLPASLFLVCTLTHAANPEPIPKSLEEQVGRLAVFIIEGFGLGNNYSNT